MDYVKKSMLWTGIISVLSIFGLIIGWTSWYTVPEGHAAVIKTWGAVGDSKPQSPGLHFKIPIVQTAENIETRVRKFTLTMPVSTTGKVGGKTDQVELQMPSVAKVSGNWAMPVEKIVNVYKEFGSLEQYEDRILEPNFLKITKSVIAKYSIEDLVSQREKITVEIDLLLREALPDVNLSNVNIEDIAFPDNIKKDIEAKQQAKLRKEAEEYELQKQNLIAQRQVNTAKAEAEAIEAISIKKAQATEREGKAEAAAIEAKAKALHDNPLIVELTKAQSWNGSLPNTVMGTNIPMLMQMPSK